VQMQGAIVPASGRPDARVAFVGARPGKDEVFHGKPFVGASGDLLWRLAPISRNDCYVTNVRKDFCFRNPTPTRSEIHAELPTLQRELENCKANLFVALGGQALYALTGHSSIDHWRGSVIPSTLLPGRKVLCSWHPAFAFRSYSARYVIQRDLRKITHESNFPDVRYTPRTFIIDPPIDQFVSLVNKLGDPVTVDIETIGDAVSRVGIGDSPTYAISIGFLFGKYTTSELRIAWRALDRVLRSRRCRGQNFQFDVTRLEKLGFDIPNIDHDTMLSHHLLWAELGAATKRKSGDRGIDSITGKHSLAFINSIYTDIPYYKDEADAAWETPNLSHEERVYRHAVYNCKDVVATHESADRLEEELTKYGQTAYHKEHILGIIRPVMAMQARGLAVDLGELNRFRERTQREVDYLQLQLNHAVGFDCNVRSPVDLRYLLHTALKLPRLKTTKKGAASTDEDTLRRLSYNSPYAAIFEKILDIRERRTLISGFLQLQTEGSEYKVGWLIHGTDTGRLSSRAVSKGPQLQNIPLQARRIFVPHPGNIFASGDLSRAEAMFVAYDSQDEFAISIFEDPSRDLYKEVAASILGKDLSGITKHERELFKRVVHASNYGMSWGKLVTVFRMNDITESMVPVPPITLEELIIMNPHMNHLWRTDRPRAQNTFKRMSSFERRAAYVLEYYHKARPALRRWQNEIANEVKRTRVLHNVFGRRRVFLGRMDEQLERAAFAYKPQSSIVGITNRGLRLLHEDGWPIVLQVHDDITLEVPSNMYLEAGSAIIKAMTYEMELHGRRFTIPVEIKWSDISWGDMKGWLDFTWKAA
jgi:uracil-DNA glycosylase family 4